MERITGPFGDYAARVTSETLAVPAMERRERDDDAGRRWDGEGGNLGMPPSRSKLIRANALARVRRAARKFELW